TSTTTGPRGRSSRFWRPRASTRAAAMGPGPTTRWRTACWPGARWRRSSTRTGASRERRRAAPLDRHPRLQRRGDPARLGAGAGREAAPLRLELRAPAVRERLARSHGGDRPRAHGRASPRPYAVDRTAQLRAGDEAGDPRG